MTVPVTQFRFYFAFSRIIFATPERMNQPPSPAAEEPKRLGNRPPESLIGLAESLRGLIETSARIAELSDESAQAVLAECTRIDALTQQLRAHALDDRVPRMGPEPAELPGSRSGLPPGARPRTSWPLRADGG